MKAYTTFFHLLVALKAASSATAKTIQSSRSLADRNRFENSTAILVVNDYSHITKLRGGFGLIPSGWNPLGYKLTSLGEEFLAFEGSRDSDVGRFLASLKERKRVKTIKSEWLEILRAAKTAQSMRIYKQRDEMIQFCLKAGLID
jgi:hypothetical protein